MAKPINYEDPKHRAAAAEILWRHDDYQVEANISSAVRRFFTETGLVDSEDIREEDPPAQGSRRAVDLRALNTFIEFKRRISTTAGLTPHPDYVQQLDDYLAQAARQGKWRTGILTDGKHWLLRLPGDGKPKTTPPYAFTLEDPDRWGSLHDWLRDRVLAISETDLPDRDAIAKSFGPSSIPYERDMAVLKKLYMDYSSFGTIKVKRQLWEDLLKAALGEIASTPDQMDDLFVRHTYLTAIVGMIVQASFGIDISALAKNDATDLLLGRDFRNRTGLQGVVDSDFFAWPTEVGGLPLLRTLADSVSRFDWQKGPDDIGAILYETVIPKHERDQLGEHYTPDWLARTIVREVVTDPLNQTVLDPACGSGTFIAEAVTHFIEAAWSAPLDPKERLDKLRFSIAGIDVHPVAVHLARSAWVLAAKPAIEDARRQGFAASVTAPIYLGDALQLRFRTEEEDMFAKHEVTVQVGGEQNTELVFPRKLVGARRKLRCPNGRRG